MPGMGLHVWLMSALTRIEATFLAGDGPVRVGGGARRRLRGGAAVTPAVGPAPLLLVTSVTLVTWLIETALTEAAILQCT